MSDYEQQLLDALKEVCAAEDERRWAKKGPAFIAASVRVDTAVYDARKVLRQRCTYTEFCSMPEKCAGTGRCQREHCCAD